MSALPAQIGPYLVERALGSGAMGSVFLAHHPRLGVPVAIKVLHERDPELLARFRREAEVMAQIRDPRVVEVYEVGLHEGEPYLVLEYCPGQDLADVLKERGALPPTEAARLVAEVAQGVAAAHAKGAIHRDLKPANVLVTATGRPKVTDFGIASAAREEGRRGSLTASGVLLGTPAYMAPEQAVDARQVDARSDVYALGAILFECLNGGPAFTGGSPLVVLAKVVEGDRARLGGQVPVELTEIVDCAMALDPGERFSGADLFAESLEDFLRGAMAPKKPSPPLALLCLLATLLGVLGAGAGWVMLPEAPVARASLATPSPSESAEPSARTQPTSARVDPSPLAEPSPSPRGAPPLLPSGALAPIASYSFSAAPGGPTYGTREYFLDKQRFMGASLKVLSEEAARGHPAALTQIALRYAEGRGLPIDLQESSRWLRAAAVRGEPQAMYRLGSLYALGQGVEVDKIEAGRWLRKSAQSGGFEAVGVLARKLPQEQERKKALARMRAQVEAAAGLGDPSAVGAMIKGSIYLGDLPGLRTWLPKGLELELRQAYLAAALLERTKATPDPALLVDYFRRAYERISTEGACGLARCYALGLGVEQDLERAKALLAEAEARDPRGVAFERIRLTWASGDREAWTRELDALYAMPPSRSHRWCDFALFLLFEVAPTFQGAEYDGIANRLRQALRRADPLRTLDGRIPFNLAILSANRLSSRSVLDKILELHRRARELGHPRAPFYLARLELLGARNDVERDRALADLEKAGEKGEPAAWRLLSNAYGSGQKGLVVSTERAIEYDERGAALHYLPSLLVLSGNYLSNGDYARARPYAEEARDLGSLSAKIDCVVIEVAEAESPERVQAALRYLESTAKTNPRACQGLANLYRLGSGVPQDLVAAERWFERARAQGLMPTTR